MDFDNERCIFAVYLSNVISHQIPLFAMKTYQLIAGVLLLTVLSSCHLPSDATNGSNPQTQLASEKWNIQLDQMMPTLGHRNWIVITDMAYPWQSGSGITTLFADEPYPAVLEEVKQMIDKAPHVFAHVYRDKELSYLTDDDVKGISSLRSEMDRICGDEVQSVPHEQLIARLDEAGRLYNVIIIKTPLTMPYTTTFFQLDCAYWNGDQQKKLDQAMSE